MIAKFGEKREREERGKQEGYGGATWQLIIYSKKKLAISIGEREEEDSE